MAQTLKAPLSENVLSGDFYGRDKGNKGKAVKLEVEMMFLKILAACLEMQL